MDVSGTLCEGKCHSIPQYYPDGILRLAETWEWTAGKEGTGTSVVKEIKMNSGVYAYLTSPHCTLEQFQHLIEILK